MHSMKQNKEQFHIAICEDDKTEQENLNTLIGDYLNEKRLDFEISLFSSGEELLEVWEEHRFVLLFLDVFMEEKSGIDTARAIRKADSHTPIVFITSSRGYAVESYEVNALYYIVKPLTREKMDHVFSKCQDLLTHYSNHLDIISDRKPKRVYTKDILYIETFGNQLVLHTQSEAIQTYTTLETLLQKAGECFLRCHRSFAINMNHVQTVEKNEFVLDSGHRVPIRTNGRAEVIQCYNRYFVESIRR